MSDDSLRQLEHHILTGSASIDTQAEFLSALLRTGKRALGRVELVAGYRHPVAKRVIGRSGRYSSIPILTAQLPSFRFQDGNITRVIVGLHPQTDYFVLNIPDVSRNDFETLRRYSDSWWSFVGSYFLRLIGTTSSDPQLRLIALELLSVEEEKGQQAARDYLGVVEQETHQTATIRLNERLRILSYLYDLKQPIYNCVFMGAPRRLDQTGARSQHLATALGYLIGNEILATLPIPKKNRKQFFLNALGDLILGIVPDYEDHSASLSRDLYFPGH